EKAFGSHSLAALQTRVNEAAFIYLNGGDLLTQAKHGALTAHLIKQRFNDLVIDEVKKSRPLVDYGHLNVECGHHRGVLESDHAGTDHDHIARNGRSLTDLVRIQYPLAEWDLGRVRRASAAGDEKIIRGQDLGFELPLDFHRVWSGE